MNALDMNTPNETSLTKAADPVYVFMSSNCSRLSGSVAFNGLENGAAVDADVKGRGAVSRVMDPSPSVADGSTGHPVANEGERLFRFMVASAFDQGYISDEGADHILNALYGRGVSHGA